MRFSFGALQLRGEAGGTPTTSPSYKGHSSGRWPPVLDAQAKQQCVRFGCVKRSESVRFLVGRSVPQSHGVSASSWLVANLLSARLSPREGWFQNKDTRVPQKWCCYAHEPVFPFPNRTEPLEYIQDPTKDIGVHLFPSSSWDKHVPVAVRVHAPQPHARNRNNQQPVGRDRKHLCLHTYSFLSSTPTAHFF